MGSSHCIKSLYGLPTELYEIKVLVDGEEFAKFEVDSKQGGLFTGMVKKYLEDPDWAKEFI